MANKLLVGVLLLAACRTEEDTTTFVVEIGTDDGGYQAIPQGGNLKAYMGPQGGFHVFLALRASGIVLDDNNTASIDFNIADATRSLDQFTEARLTLLSRDGAFQTVPAARVTLDIQSLDEVDGNTLHVSAVVTDTNGFRVMGNVDATVIAVR